MSYAEILYYQHLFKTEPIKKALLSLIRSAFLIYFLIIPKEENSMNKILIVEHDVAISNLLSKILITHNHIPTQAFSGTEPKFKLEIRVKFLLSAYRLQMI